MNAIEMSFVLQKWFFHIAKKVHCKKNPIFRAMQSRERLNNRLAYVSAEIKRFKSMHDDLVVMTWTIGLFAFSKTHRLHMQRILRVGGVQ